MGQKENVNLYFNDIDIKENLMKCSQVTQLLSIRRIQTGTKWDRNPSSMPYFVSDPDTRNTQGLI